MGDVDEVGGRRRGIDIVVRRYEPLALVIAAIIGVALFLPDRDSGDGTSVVPLRAPQTSVPTPAGATTTSTVASASPPTTISQAPRPQAFASPPSLTTTTTTTTTTSTSTTTTSTTIAADAPLAVAGSGWATAGAGSPTADAGVPEGTLPVATRFGQIDKASFVRLTGTATTLVLAENPEGRRDAAGDPAVAACRITDESWQEQEAMSLDEAPTWDDKQCVVGELSEGAEGQGATWRFDLSAYADRTDRRGWALVPAPEAPIDFQVTFHREAAS